MLIATNTSCSFSFLKCLQCSQSAICPSTERAGFEKMFQADLSPLNVSCQVSQHPWLKLGKWRTSPSPRRLIEKRCLDDSEEQRSWDEKAEKKTKSFYPSQPRQQRRQNRYFISLLNSLDKTVTPPNCWCVGVFVWCDPGVSGERLQRSVVTAAVFL